MHNPYFFQRELNYQYYWLIFNFITFSIYIFPLI
jgi:hypothetical protein